MNMFFLDFLRLMPPLAAIFVISLFVAVFVTVIYKFTTNQGMIKTLHQEMKALREAIKGTKDPSQASALNKQLMEKTMQQMTSSMKSTFITLVPMFVIFAWIGGNFAFLNVEPGEEFTASMEFVPGTAGAAAMSAPTLELLGNSSQTIANGKAVWRLRGSEGVHVISYSFGDETYTREVLIAKKWDYLDPYLEKEKKLFGLINTGDKNPVKRDSPVVKVAVDLPPVHPFGSLLFFGWQPGWLGSYFLFTLLLTFPVRKLLKVH